jgi:ParB family chromosome partitioning protein
MIDIARIDLDPTRLCEGRKVEVLATNIAQHRGLVHPLILRPVGDRFVIVEGARRLRALRWLSAEAAPARFVAGRTAEAALLSMLEAKDILGIDAFTEADAIERAGNHYNLGLSDIAAWAGTSRRYLLDAYSLRLRACPELRSAVVDGWVMPGQARHIAARPVFRQREILKTILLGGREVSDGKGSRADHCSGQRYRRSAGEESAR